MRVSVLAPVLLAATITACESNGPGTTIDPVPDAAIGTYDMQSAQTRTANCGGATGTIANGVIILSDESSFTKIDINTTPGGSNVCGFSGGTWVRVNATTLTLTNSIAASNPVQATIVGDDLTLQFSSAPVAYKRRAQP